MKALRSFLLVSTLACLDSPAASLLWTNTAGGTWNTAANWNPNQVPGAADTALITSAGTYTVTLNVDATVVGLSLGAATGVQTLSGGSRTLTLNGPSSINGQGVLGLGNGTIAGAGGLTNLGTINADSATINCILVNQGLIVFRAVSVLGSNYINQAGATTRVLGDGSLSFAQLTVNNGFTNNGLVELSSVVNGQQAILNVSSGSLVNAAGGQINVLPGTGGARTLGVQLINQGTLTVGQGLTLSRNSAQHINSGTISLTNGDMTITLNGAGASFTTTGLIDIQTGRTLTVSSGTFNYSGGSVGGGGTLNCSSTILNLVPNFSNETTTLNLSSATVNGPGILTNAVGRTFGADSATINCILVNQGLIVFRAVSVLGSNYINQAGATTRVLGDGSLSFAQLTVNNGFTNNGLVELSSVVNGQQAILNVSSGSLVNAAGGQINVLPGTGGARTLGVQLINQGTLTVGQGLTLSRNSAQHINSGTISLTNGDMTITLNGAGASFTTTGLIDIQTGRTLTVSSGTFNYSGGSVGGGGTLNCSSTILNLVPNFSNETTTLNLSSATVNGPGILTNAVGRTFGADSATINCILVNQGLIVFRAVSVLGSNYINQAGATTRVLGDGSLSFAQLTVNNGFTNNGLVELSSVVNGQQAILNVSSGSLVNAAGGQINVLPGTGGARTLGVQLINQGTLTVGQGLTLSRNSAQHINSGTISLTNGDMTITLNGAGASFTTTGLIDIQTGRTLTVSSGTFNYSGGTIGGGGTLSFSGSTVNLVPNFSNETTTLNLSSATVNGPGILTNAVGRTFGADSATINCILVNQGLIVFRAVSVLGSNYINQAGATTRVLGDGSLSFAQLTVNNGFTNNGLVELSSVVNGQQAILNVSSGSLVNAAGGQINVLPGTGGARTLGVQLINQGTLTVGQGLTLSRNSAQHINSGTISLTNGDMTITLNGAGASFTTTGLIDIQTGRTLTVSSGTFNYSGGTIGGGGTLSFSGSTVNLVPNFSNETTTLNLSSATVNGPGILTNAVGRTFGADSATINCILVNQGLIVFRAVSVLGSNYINQAGATTRVLGDGSLSFAQLTVNNGFTNNGLVELSSVVNGQQAILNVSSGSLVNAAGGQINVLPGTGGARTLGVQLINQGTLTVGQGLTLSRNSAQHINSGTISLTNGDMTITLNGAGASFTTTGLIDIQTGRTLTVSSGTFNYSGGTIGGGGTLSFSGSTVNLVPNFSNETTTLNLSSATVNGPGILTNAVGRTFGADSATINCILVNQGLIVFRAVSVLGSNYINQAGATTRVLGDGSLSFAQLTVNNGFTNNGLVELSSVVNGQQAILNVSSGSLVNAAGGQINVLPGTGGARTLGVQLINQGTLTVGQGLTLSRNSAQHINSGTISLTNGDMTITLNGAGAAFTNSGLIDIQASRRLTASAGNFQNTGPGIIQGRGVLDVINTTFANGGDVNPGTSAGVLTVNGSFPQIATGRLNIEIGGTNQGSEYDLLVVSNTVSLGGDLALRFINGFQVGVNTNEAFTVLAAGGPLSGIFDNTANTAEGQRIFTADGFGSFAVRYIGSPTGAVVLNGFETILPVVANFSASPTNGIIPFTVGFTNLTAGSATNFIWSFGDGFSSSAVNPVHTYTNPGSFSVSLIASGPGGTNTLNRNGLIVASLPSCNLVVTNLQDGAPGSLRAALLCANSTPGFETITFNLPGAVVHILNLTNALPIITDPVIIDGFSQPGASTNTLVNGDNAVRLIELDGTGAGIGPGLDVQAGGSAVRGLIITRFGAGGISVSNASDGLLEGNLIFSNAAPGVTINASTNCSIVANSIFANSLLGVDLGGDGSTANDACDVDTGANNLQNFPILTLASNTANGLSVRGTLNSTPNSRFSLEFFANTVCGTGGSGQGESLLGRVSVVTDGACNASFTATFTNLVAVGRFITATATDTNGNTSEFSACTTVLNQAPLALCRDVTNAANLNCQAIVSAAAVDNGSFDPDGTVTNRTLTPPGPYGKGATIVTLTVTDNLGASASCQATITVVDQTPPTLTCPGDIVRSTDPGQCSASNVTYTANATDNCPGVSVAFNPPSGSIFPKGTNTVVCTATDTSGNTNICSFRVIVNDTQPPSIVCPPDIVRSTDPGQCSAAVAYNATPVDNCPGATVAFNPPSGSLFPKGTNTVTCLATDTSGNTNACSFRVIVNDTQPPTITCPADILRSTDPGQCSASNITYTAIPADNCPGATVTFNPPSGSIFPKGTNTVACVATDTSGNTNACSFRVIINDTQAPTIVCPADIVRSTDPGQCSASNITYSAIPSDNCPGASVAFVPASGSTFPKGTNTVLCTATDSSGNTNTCAFRVIVNDSQAPTIICPANITLIAPIGQSNLVVNYAPPIPADNCPGVSAVEVPPPGSSFALGTNTVVCTATDSSGNAAACSFKIIILQTNADTTPPSITCPANITVTAAQSATNAVVNYPAPVVTDDRPGATATSSPPSGSVFALGSNVVTCVATDAAGNTNACTFTVTVNPFTATTANLVLGQAGPGNAVVGSNLTYTLTVSNAGPDSAFNVTLIDNLPAVVSLVSTTNQSGSSTQLEDTVVCVIPVLPAGNSASVSIVATATTPGRVCNFANVHSDQNDFALSNNATALCTVVTRARTGADLTLTAVGSPDPVVAGGSLTYRLRVRNNGPHLARDVTLTDILPPGVTFLSASSNCINLNGVITCSIGNLARGSNATETIVVTANATGLVCNTASVIARESDPLPENNSDTACAEVTASTQPIHDLALVRITAPPVVNLSQKVPSRKRFVVVRIQNRSPHPEAITNLTGLVSLRVESLGALPDLVPALVAGRPQRGLPITLAPKQFLNVFFQVTFSTNSVNDPIKARGRALPCHEDYRYFAVVHHEAIDGQPDSRPENDFGPRSVNPLATREPNPDGSISDTGVGKLKPDHTFGADVRTDVVVKRTK